MLESTAQLVLLAVSALKATTLQGTAHECVFGPKTIAVPLVDVQIVDSSRVAELVVALRLLGHRNPMSIGEPTRLTRHWFSWSGPSALRLRHPSLRS